MRLRRALLTAPAALVCFRAAVQTPVVHPWQGKRVAFFGDSIQVTRGGITGVQAVRKRDPVFSHETFKGRINLALGLLKETFPDKQIVLLTLIHRGYAKFGARNIQPDENYVNTIGEYVDAYVGAIKEAGNLWSVPVSGIFPLAKSHDPCFNGDKRDPAHPDRLYPNAEGHHPNGLLERLNDWRRFRVEVS